MVPVVEAMAGAVSGLGLFVLLLGLRGRSVLHAPNHRLARRRERKSEHQRATLSVAAGAGTGLVVWWASGWPVAGVGSALVVIRALRRTSRAHRDEVALADAIATWVEQLRDTLSGASGLQSALIASGRLAPEALSAPLGELVARLEYERTPAALRRFADDVSHPTADFVVAALVVAVEHQARDLTSLLGQLAVAAREEAHLRTRVWIGRTRTRTAVRMIGLIVPAMLFAILLVDREYLRAYDSWGGQVVLATIALLFAAALAGMERLAVIRLPERFLVSPVEAT